MAGMRMMREKPKFLAVAATLLHPCSAVPVTAFLPYEGKRLHMPADFSMVRAEPSKHLWEGLRTAHTSCLDILRINQGVALRAHLGRGREKTVARTVLSSTGHIPPT